MRYAIFSDVHGNLEALTSVLDYYQNEKIDKFIFNGDIVGYGANPCECLRLLKDLNPIVVAGNHDWGAIDNLSLDYFNEYAKEALTWTKERLSIEDNRYLKSFELIYQENNFICVHSSLQNPEEFNYLFGISDAYANFFLLKKQLLFIGHTHRVEAYRCSEGKVSCSLESPLKIKPKEKYIINTGSVGQPRDRDSRASLCIYDSDENIVIFKRLEYNIKKAADKILAQKLPQMLAERLYVGW